MILSHPLDFESSFSRKIIRRINTTEIFIITIDDLITMKKFSGRERDLNDVYLLEKPNRYKKLFMIDRPKYDLEEEKIIEYSKLTAQEKLQWLEEAMMFNELVFTDKEKEIRKIIHDIC